MTLEKVFMESESSEEYFRQKRILFVGSESYDAATITILEGLSQLGFEICTLHKPNINSWFTNKVVDDVRNLKFDFVLSNLHWGTRWSYYKKYELASYTKVLIDGDDDKVPFCDEEDHGYRGRWRKKYQQYVHDYVQDPPEQVKKLDLMPYRWVEPLTDYEPDVVFASQKRKNDNSSVYLPFGIHEEYKDSYLAKSTSERSIDLAHISGPGEKRRSMETLINRLQMIRLLPGRIYNGSARGGQVAPDAIRSKVSLDDKIVHGYIRWTFDKSYFDVLNNSKVLVYPGIDKWPFWDSKRPWEGYASGCLVLMEAPNIDVREYPITEICDYTVYHSTYEFISKCRYLLSHEDVLDRFRISAVERAWKFFSPLPIARYFLMNVAKRTGPAGPS
jgi:hypothetical protein